MKPDTTGKLPRGSARLYKSKISKNFVSPISHTNRFLAAHDISNSSTPSEKSFKNAEEIDKIHITHPRNLTT